MSFCLNLSPSNLVYRLFRFLLRWCVANSRFFSRKVFRLSWSLCCIVFSLLLETHSSSCSSKVVRIQKSRKKLFIEEENTKNSTWPVSPPLEVFFLLVLASDVFSGLRKAVQLLEIPEKIHDRGNWEDWNENNDFWMIFDKYTGKYFRYTKYMNYFLIITWLFLLSGQKKRFINKIEGNWPKKCKK